MRSLIITVAVLALLASWALLGRSQAAPTPAQANESYLPLVGNPPRATPTATATATRVAISTATSTTTATTQAAQPTATATATATIPAANCDPSYPGVCIPPPPPDLNCGDITFRRFTVIGSDPHGFDTDGDGVGCESG